MISVRSYETESGCPQAKLACCYHVARIFAEVSSKTQGRVLIAMDRELWKMGFDVSNRGKIYPKVTAQRSREGDVTSWTLNPGRLWFPRNLSAYERFWPALSGGVAFSDITRMHEANPYALEAAMEGIREAYSRLLPERERNLPKMPGGLMRNFAMKGWLETVASECQMGEVARCCLEGVPVEDVLA